MESNQQKLFTFIKAISEFFSYFMKKWWIFLIAVLFGGGLGILYATIQKSTFRSKLTFALEDNNSGLNGALNLAAQFGINIGSTGKDIFAGDNIIAILTSRRIIEDVLLTTDTVNNKEVTLAQRYLQIEGLDEKIAKNKRLGNINYPVGLNRRNYSYHQDSILFEIYNIISKSALTVDKPDRKFNLYKIEFKSSNEKYSKIFIERLVNSAIGFYTELKTKRSKQTIAILEEQISRIKGGTINAITSKANVQDQNLNPAFENQSAKIQKIQIDISAYGGAYAEVYKNLEIAKYQYLQEIPLLQIVDEPKYPMENLKKGRKSQALLFGFIFFLLTFMILYILKIRKLYVSYLQEEIDI
jgi:uncharacterized protein involved in exopolysaccharide biosynthesis